MIKQDERRNERGIPEQSLFERFFDRSFAMFCVTDLDGTLLKVNKSWQRVLGYQIDELQGRSFLELVHPDDVVKTKEQMKQQTEGGEILTFENRYRHRDGSWRSLQWSSVFDEEKGLIHGVARDVTTRNEREDELRDERDEADVHSAAKNDLLARMSHELRTPLNSVIGFADLIVRRGESIESQKLDRFARNIRSSGHHLLTIVNDLLELSELDSGNLELSYTRFSPVEAIQQAVEVITPVADRKGLTLSIKPTEAMEELQEMEEIEADRTKVVQVLYNLMTNAVKFTRPGGTIVISVAKDDEHDPPMMMFSIADNGIGIAAQKLSKIFETFEQINTLYVREQEGIGVGLSLSRRLAEIHGGTVEATSPGLGHGSTFTAIFPVTPPPETTAQLIEKAKGDDRPLVLVVEDTPEAAELVVEYLDVGGYRAIVVSDGASVVERARSLKPAAITLDILVPGSDGWEILRDLRSDPELANIPVIVASVVHDQKIGLALGAVGYLVKPVSDTDMLEALARFVPAGAPREEAKNG